MALLVFKLVKVFLSLFIFLQRLIELLAVLGNLIQLGWSLRGYRRRFCFGGRACTGSEQTENCQHWDNLGNKRCEHSFEVDQKHSATSFQVRIPNPAILLSLDYKKHSVSSKTIAFDTLRPQPNMPKVRSDDFNG
jgi:hypothetical protein